MRLHGLLSWYDEPVEALVVCLAGLRSAGVDHVIALDGAYALYPDARASSHPSQHAAIVGACRELGMACTLHVPIVPWTGNEVEKRTFHFALAWAAASEGDWFWVQDADQVVVRAPENLKARLATTEHDVADVELVDVVALQAQRLDWPPRFAMRSLFRAQPIIVGPAHCTYSDSLGRVLWNGTGVAQDCAGFDLAADVEVEHRPHLRPTERLAAKQRYYVDRDAALIERGNCECGAPAVRMVPLGWKNTNIGPIASERVEACETCGKRLDKDSRRQLRAIGLHPADLARRGFGLRTEARNGQIPANA